ncbi:elongation factor 1-beta' [Euwallacea fornicatus]|uniref:elongation factor 1-beta' n=1 Tax=Euwallacea fornicatus TaxID=995702 RepID=UPI0033904915
MAFGNLKTDKGVSELNKFLEDKSYINGYQISKSDIDTANQLAKAPNVNQPHALRWYNHIKSFTAEELKSIGASPLTAGKPTISPTADHDNDDDDDLDLFDSDNEEDAEAAKIRAARLQAYSERKAKKPELIAKSSVILEVKPWDDETNMKEMETCVRNISMEGLLWGASKLVPVGYGIDKLQIMCVVEDEKVSIDELTEKIQEFEDFVQSVDVAAFNKI